MSGDDRQPQSQRNDRAAPDGDDHRASEIYDGYALQHACPPQLIPIESRPQAPVERDADREEIKDILGIVAEETQATVVGVTALAPDAARIHLELLLLPFSARSHSPVSLTGLLAPLSPIEGSQVYGTLKEFSVTSWRHLQQDRNRPRALRKWSLIRGLTVYEGLR